MQHNTFKGTKTCSCEWNSQNWSPFVMVLFCSASFRNQPKTLPKTNRFATVCPWKMMVGRRFGFLLGLCLFLGSNWLLASGKITSTKCFFYESLGRWRWWSWLVVSFEELLQLLDSAGEEVYVFEGINLPWFLGVLGLVWKMGMDESRWISQIYRSM